MRFVNTLNRDVRIVIDKTRRRRRGKVVIEAA